MGGGRVAGENGQGGNEEQGRGGGGRNVRIRKNVEPGCRSSNRSKRRCAACAKVGGFRPQSGLSAFGLVCQT